MKTTLKKAKHGNEKIHWFDPSKVTFSSLSKVNFEEFQEDPFTLVTKVGYLDTKLLKQFEAYFELRKEGKRLNSYLKWMKGELEDRQGKLDMIHNVIFVKLW